LLNSAFFKRLPCIRYFFYYLKKLINRKIEEKPNTGKGEHRRLDCYFSQGFPVAGA